jgi:OmpA-OmpF porin, OOP family
MENSQNSQSWWGGLNNGTKAVIYIILAVVIIFPAWKFGLIPGLSSSKSKEVNKADISSDAINSKMDAAMLPVPKLNESELANTDNRPEIRLMNWVWFGNAGIFTANGGLVTMKGSLMDKYGVSLHMMTNNSVSDMKREQLAFIASYAKGNKNPSTGVHFVTLMGDGFPAYISAMNKQIAKAYGSEYCLKNIGIVGFSLGEDCIIGPPEWKENKQNMKGAVISAVIGDGDWGLGVRNQGDNKVLVNPDPGTYDPNAANYIPAPDDDFMKAAEEAIIGRVVTLKVKDKNGRLTGQTVQKKIEGAATWFPGDRRMFEKTGLVKIVSTSEYPNQMGTIIVGCDKWMKENSKQVVDFLSAALTASNQIKQYPQWFRYSTQLAPRVFCSSPEDCSEKAEDWEMYAIPNGGKMQNVDGVTVSVGGTQMANLADNKKYFGLKGGNNYYKSVYDYFSGVLKDLNPSGFMDDVKQVVPYEDAVDLSYLERVNIEAGQTTKIDYSKNKGEVVAKRSWKIEFETGKANILPSGEKELEQLFNSVNIAVNAKVQIVGHTDDVGDDESNMDLSLQRAKAVKLWLLNRSNNSFPPERFTVDGKGETQPLTPNISNAARAQNRRVEITLLD